ncbi:MAG: ParB/RepB/Spo0J family partition protein, partial [Thiolinea sp.]
MSKQTGAIELSTTVEIPWNLLRKGEANVRVVKAGNAEDEALIANIGETGVILENLIVAPLDDESGCYGVHAGGRRWSAIGVNVEKGVFPDTFPVPCRVQTGGSLTAVSLAENLQAPMHPADEFSAFQRMQKEGMTVEDIALHFGLPKQRVVQRLKLAQVAKRIIAAYRKSDIDLKTIMAFTLAGSQKQQLEVFKALKGHCYAHAVKRALTGESIHSDDRLVRYIGIEAYTANGGDVIADLFSEHDHLPDRELVERLALEKLEKAAERLRKKEGWLQVKVTTERYFHTHEYHHIEPEPVDVPAVLTEQLATLIKDQNALHESDNDWTPELEAQDEQLSNEIERIETAIDGYRQYTDEHKANALCFITISEAGKTVISRGYLTHRAARKAEARAAGNDVDSTEKAAAIPKALSDDLGVHRQQIAKVALLDNQALASDVLLYTLCHDILSPGYHHKTLAVRIDEVKPTDEKFTDCQAMQRLAVAHSQLPTEWLAIASATERFATLRNLSQRHKQALMTYCVSATLTAELGSNDQDNISEAVLQDLAPDYAALWR